MVERRKAVRLETRLAVSYHVLNSGAVGKAETKNFSADGVRFIAARRLEVGEELDVTLHFPDADPVVARGKVIWKEWRPSRDPAVPGVMSDIGVKFLSIDPKDREHLIQYVKLNMP